MRFAAKYDRTTKIVSTAVIVILTLIAVFTQPVVVGIIGGITLLAAFGFSPQGYEVKGGRILIRRLLGNVAIPVGEIQRIRSATEDDLRGAVRVWGSGALFGYFGTFRTPKLGFSTWYVTNRAYCVVIETGSKKVVISPEGREGFLSAVGPVASESSGEGIATGGRRSTTLRRVLIGIVVGCVLVSVWLAVSYAPGLPETTLTRSSLEIHDRFYPVTIQAAQVDEGKVRVVDLAREKEWNPAAKVDGFANEHYRAGWFRLANGQTVRMYRAQGTRLVLLPGRNGGPTVLLEAADPDGFVSRIQGEWK